MMTCRTSVRKEAPNSATRPSMATSNTDSSIPTIQSIIQRIGAPGDLDVELNPLSLRRTDSTCLTYGRASSAHVLPRHGRCASLLPPPVAAAGFTLVRMSFCLQQTLEVGDVLGLDETLHPIALKLVVAIPHGTSGSIFWTPW